MSCSIRFGPGPFLTEFSEVVTKSPEQYQWWTSRVPLGHWGKPDQLAGVVIFLASEASSYVTGSILMVDGGWTAQ